MRGQAFADEKLRVSEKDKDGRSFSPVTKRWNFFKDTFEDARPEPTPTLKILFGKRSKYTDQKWSPTSRKN